MNTYGHSVSESSGSTSGIGATQDVSYMPSIEDDFDDDLNFNSSNFAQRQEYFPITKGEPSQSTETKSDMRMNSNAKAGTTSTSHVQAPLHRNACAICRKRKLKCDGAAPACGRCARLGHDCVYVESRRKSGPKRGYVKGLESRLAQVEGLLKEQEKGAGAAASIDSPVSLPGLGDSTQIFPGYETYTQPMGYEDAYLRNSVFIPDLAENMHFSSPSQNQFFTSEPGIDGSNWALSELGVQEPLPPQDVMDELTQIYFQKIHPSNDMIHQYRFLTSLTLSSNARPSIALRYAMWTLASGISPSHKHLSPLFYHRTRKYAEADESGSRAKYVNIRHAQAWILIGTYEYKMLMFPKSWLSIGKAVRLCQMLGLHRLDGRGLGHRQALEKPGDEIEKEERRRTFWMAFGMDRYAAASTGWPVIVDERDILTFLPSSEAAFENGVEEPGIFLQDAMQPQHASSLSAFAGVVVVCSLIGHIFEHLSRPNPDDIDSDPNSDFWRSHRKIDNILLNMVLHLPSHLRLPAGSSSSNTIFLNMTLQSATICLHQAAIAKAEKVGQGFGYETVVVESRARCAAAAHEIASIMKRIAHFDLSTLHPYIPFPLYLSTRIFAQTAKSNPSDDNANSLVRFLLSALLAMKEVNPLVESYLAQLDMEDLGLEALRENVRMFGLQRGVQSLSLSLSESQEEEEAKPWISYVSPMVRIVEVEEDSMSPPPPFPPPASSSTNSSTHPRHSSTPSTTDVNTSSKPTPQAKSSTDMPHQNPSNNNDNYLGTASKTNTDPNPNPNPHARSAIYNDTSTGIGIGIGLNHSTATGMNQQQDQNPSSSARISTSPLPLQQTSHSHHAAFPSFPAHSNMGPSFALAELSEHEMNFDVPCSAADGGFEGMDCGGFGVDAMSFPGPEAWGVEGEELMLGGIDGGGRGDLGRGNMGRRGEGGEGRE